MLNIISFLVLFVFLTPCFASDRPNYTVPFSDVILGFRPDCIELSALDGHREVCVLNLLRPD